MGKIILSVFFGLVIIVGGASSSVAHHAGGVEVGDLETGSVVGQAFKELPVDAEIQAIEIGTMKAWYPPTTIVDFKGRSYLFYHNAELVLNGEKGAIGRRSVCVEYLYYNSDGTMKPVTQTVEGVSVPPRE